jgi:putative ABC transport system permease protein
MRNGEGRFPLAGATLDFKLGARMLVKYPGLTLVGGLAIAIAIAIGATFFEFATQAVYPSLPLPDGDRIVAIRTWDTTAAVEERRVAADALRWRSVLTSVDEVSAFRTLEQNLIIGDGAAEPIETALVTASAFRVTQVAPLLGRVLVEADEQPGAAPVIVVGYDVWRQRFGGDPQVIGRTVRLGRDQAVIVGVMPDHYAFPSVHSLWAPLSLQPDGEPRGGPAVQVVGRLAGPATIEDAQAQLNLIMARAAIDSPDTHARLRAEVIPYAQSMFGFEIGGRVLYAFNAFFIMFLILVCGNVAGLMYARAAARESDIVVRTAIGASRGRIVTQLFVEALVLGGAATLAGLAFAEVGLRWLLTVLEADSGQRLPFWFHAGLSPVTVMYAGALTVLGAAISGIGPALRVTRSLVPARHDSIRGRGRSVAGPWAIIIVSQVAVTVVFPAATFFIRREVVQIQSTDPGVRADQYLSVRLDRDQEGGVPLAFESLRDRVAAEPDVTAVTLAEHLPGTLHQQRSIEVENPATPARADRRTRLSVAAVTTNFFEVFDAPIEAGRGFAAADLAPGSPGTIVNQSFVRRVLDGANPLGRRVRVAAVGATPPGRWHEIVGVARDLGMVGDDSSDGAGVYFPLASESASTVYMAVHVTGDPRVLTPRLRAIATSVDPTVRLRAIMPLDTAGASLWLEFDFLWRILVFVSVTALLLALAGIYAITAFTVARRTSEIGLRVALGADARSIVGMILSQALTPVGVGVTVGGALVFLLTQAITGLSPVQMAIVSGYMLVMLAVCMLACFVPTRRALAVQPTQAMRGDGV